MRFDIITIFPHIFDSYFNESILKRAQEKKLEQERKQTRGKARDLHKGMEQMKKKLRSKGTRR